MEHINSVKYILRKRNLLQKELILYRPDGTMLFNKQYVSKVIHGHFRIPVEAISEWSSILDIPPDYFVDKETGKCKILSSMDTKEIDSYIDAQFYIENTEKDNILSRSAEAEIALRHHSLSVNITKLQRNIRKDIYSINQDVDNEITALNIQEANLEFYRKITKLHRTNLLSNMEWDSFFNLCLDMLSFRKQGISPFVVGILRKTLFLGDIHTMIKILFVCHGRIYRA